MKKLTIRKFKLFKVDNFENFVLYIHIYLSKKYHPTSSLVFLLFLSLCLELLDIILLYNFRNHKPLNFQWDGIYVYKCEKKIEVGASQRVEICQKLIVRIFL